MVMAPAPTLRTPRDYVTAWLLGLIAFATCGLGYHIHAPPVTISFDLALTFAALAALAYGWRAALIAAIPGLTAFIPLRIWASNGYANLVSSLVLTLWLLALGAAAERHPLRPAWWRHPLAAALPACFLYMAAVYVGYPLVLPLNPPPWAPDAARSIPTEVLGAICLKTFVALQIQAAAASALLLTHPVRRVLGLDPRPHGAGNTLIVAVAIAGALALWFGTLVLSSIFSQPTFSMPAFDGQFEVVEAMTLVTFLTGALYAAHAVVYLTEGLRARADEQRLSAASLQKSEEKLRAIFDGVEEAVILLDPVSGEIQQVNRRATELLGRREPALVGTRLGAHGEGLAHDDGPSLHALAASDRRDSTWTVRTGNGALRETLVVFRLARIDDRDALLCTVRDVTEQRRAEEALAQARRLDAIGQLAGGVAHDFNNMLAAIRGAADLLELELEGRVDAAESLDIIRNASDRARDLTRQLLDFARKGRGARRSVDLHAAIRASTLLLRRTVDRNVEITEHFADARPVVIGDETQLQSALLNLGVNAAHAMPNGGHLTISTELVADAERVRITVTDDGVGIAPEHLERIFEPFFTTREGTGTGLGLAAVYGIVQQCGGDIRVQSRPGHGTSFVIELPLSETAPLEIRATQVDATALAGKTVLLVDDEPLVRKSIRALLVRLGLSVLEASDGAEAIVAFEQHRAAIDLVLLDAIMPNVDGRACFARLRALDPSVRVVLCSGYARDADVQALMDAGLTGSLRKPFGAEQLSAVLVAALAASTSVAR